MTTNHARGSCGHELRGGLRGSSAGRRRDLRGLRGQWKRDGAMQTQLTLLQMACYHATRRALTLSPSAIEPESINCLFLLLFFVEINKRKEKKETEKTRMYRSTLQMIVFEVSTVNTGGEQSMLARRINNDKPAVRARQPLLECCSPSPFGLTRIISRRLNSKTSLISVVRDSCLQARYRLLLSVTGCCTLTLIVLRIHQLMQRLLYQHQ